jgi:hypothetical protein
MLPVYDVTTTTNFIHPKDTSEPKTIFSIGVIDAKAQAWIDKEFTQMAWKSGAIGENGKPSMEPVINIDRSNKQLELVKLGLRGATNFSVELKFTEQQYAFGKRTVLDDASLNAVKPYIPELATAIENNTNIAPGDEKK